MTRDQLTDLEGVLLPYQRHLTQLDSTLAALGSPSPPPAKPTDITFAPRSPFHQISVVQTFLKLVTLRKRALLFLTTRELSFLHARD